MILPLEDGCGDILSKAQKGLGISTETLAERTGVSESMIRSMRKGDYDSEAAARLAAALQLKPQALQAIAEGRWRPEEPAELTGFAHFSTPFHDWQVNAFLVWDEATRAAVAFDTGTDASPMVETLERKGLKLQALFLTHAHRDHVAGIPALRAKREFPIYLSASEPGGPRGGTRIGAGETKRFGGLSIEGFETPGHTEGGMSFRVGGLGRGIAIVGDALFAGSMGGTSIEAYERGIDSLQRILELPEQTRLAPGHGPLTTVAEELRMNCFYRG
ncbi:MBL fold metallo-hydrolase [Pelagicoccus sp. SDUM812003]|uniref:MBL fold metallo-hydrolase n=1 Tax=Pelagicoccus sp. SDUM812003 TaxID=3041267 RepID=UPI00280E3065|nr:MBL fold metallo-hydrolase [Pelagicoccus sp. SDUM812003]MDQ8204535.1 MBL fold metallo-hydrolase [Pelagicoccus sp. SDUM812003]